MYSKWKQEDGILQSESGKMLQTRLTIFKANKASVDANNADETTGWTATIDNQFSFLTDSEKSSHLGLNATEAVVERSRRDSVWGEPEPAVVMEKRASLDYISKLPAVKNQGSCGSCWAFGAMAALEYQVNRRAGSSLKALSEQQFLDCTYEGTRDGCNGGWPTQAYTVAKASGSKVESMGSRPYTGSDGTCNVVTEAKNKIAGYTIQGSTYLAQGDAAMLTAVMNSDIGVISVAIGVYSNDGFYSYKSGIFGNANMECMTKGINHAVDVVGYGDGYWMVRNSWGGSWGADGYMKMARGYNLCNIAKYGHYPVVTGQDANDGEEEEEDEGNDDEGSDDEEDEEDGGCGGGLTRCCDGTCKHVHMCPKSCDDDDEEEDDEETEPATEEVCSKWDKVESVVCKGKLGKMNMNLATAMEGCDAEESCLCVSCKKNGNKKCGLRKKTKTAKKTAKFASYFCQDDKRRM